MRLKRIFFALSSLEKLLFLGAIAVFTLSFALKVTFYVDAHTEIAPGEGGEYREGIVGQPVFINPIVPTTSADREIARLVFGSLYEIAETIKPSENGKVWTVRLKQDLKWHDGEPLTSDDVIFSLEIVQDKEGRSPLFAAFQGVSAERISELEIKFTLQSSYAFFGEEHVRSLSLIPKHKFEDLPVQNFKLSTFGLKPVGFGPYRAVSYDKDERGVIGSYYLEANENYANGKPHISNFVFKFYRNEKELIDAFNNGKIDGFGLATASGLSLSGEEKSLDIRHDVKSLKSSRYYAIFINQALSDSELKDIKVRKALSESINRTDLISRVFEGNAKEMYGPTTLTEKPDYEEKLLNEEVIETGTSETADTEAQFDILKDLKLTITLTDEEFLTKTGEILKERWESFGAEVELQIFSLKDLQEKILKNTDYEMLLFGNIAGQSEDLFSFWHSSRRFYPDQNLSLYQNKKVDALLESYRKNIESETRTENLKNISDLIANDYPALFLYSPNYIYITTPALKGFESNNVVNVASDRFEGIEKWFLKTRRIWPAAASQENTEKSD